MVRTTNFKSVGPDQTWDHELHCPLDKQNATKMALVNEYVFNGLNVTQLSWKLCLSCSIPEYTCGKHVLTYLLHKS